MQQTVTIRAAHQDEIQTVASFWMTMYEEAGLWRRDDFVPGWEQRFVEYFARRAKRGEALLTVAADGERIIGTAGAVLADGYPAAVHGLRFGYIFGVRVEPEYRGRGCATALTRSAIAFLKSIDCRRIRLHASEMGRPLYERLGFVPTNEMQLKDRG